MGNSNKTRLTLDISYEPDSALELVSEFLRAKPQSKRMAVETALICFYLPEVLKDEILSSQQEWLIKKALIDLEGRLKLFQCFFGKTDNFVDQNIVRILPQAEAAVTSISRASQQLSSWETDIDDANVNLDGDSDDDNFDDAGI